MQDFPAQTLLLSCALLAPFARAQQDNVLIILADDLGVDMVPVYGESQDPAPMPNVNALAARGVLFRNAWANTVCSATRAALHTGRHGFRTGVGTWIPDINGGELELEEITLPEMLDIGGSGYAHSLIGKWHLGTVGGDLGPNLAGWSHFAGFLHGSTHYWQWDRTVNGVTQPWNRYTTTQMVDDALAWIGQQNKPWLCFLSLNAPHAPFHIPPPRLQTQNLPPPGSFPSAPATALYRAMVQAMDTEIGRLLATLGPELANTNVIFMGDNGTPKNVGARPFPTRRAKTTPYEGGVNVPLIVAGPAVSSPGREVPALVSAVDVFGTVADLCGVDLQQVIPPWVSLDSVSFAPYLGNPQQAPLRQFVYTERFNGPTWEWVNQNGFAAARDSRHKLIQHYQASASGDDGPISSEMYDLVVDRFENNDLLLGTLTAAQATSHAGLVAEIAKLRTPLPAVHVYGNPTCPGSNGYPEIRVSGVPQVGAPYSVHLENGPVSSIGWLLTGSSSTRWGAVRLPMPLALLGAETNCTVLSSGQKSRAMETGPLGHLMIPMQVPTSLSLVGDVLFHSWLLADPHAPNNVTGFTTSNAAALVVGL